MFPDSLQPARLLWGFLALPIVAFYYWTFRRQREEVATYTLWSRALGRRSSWSRWRRSVSLAVQLTILALLILSLAQLDWSLTARNVRSLVLVIDTSASMKAADVQPSRFAQSLSEARRLVAGLARDERAAILSAGSQPRVHCRLTPDKGRLNQILDSLAPSDEPGRIEPAVELAKRIVAHERNGVVFVLTDGRFAGAAQLAARKNVHLKIAAGEASNLAITRLAARQSPVTDEHEILVEAANFSLESTVATIELSLSGEELERITLKLSPGGSGQKVIPARISHAGLLTARLHPSNDFPTDDAAAALVISRVNRRVTLLGDDDTPVAAALRAIPHTTLQIVSDVSQPLPPADVTVIAGRAVAVLPPGNVLVISPDGPCDLWEVAGMAQGRFEARSQSGDPPLAGVDFSDAVIEELIRLSFKTSARTLASAKSGDPLVSAIERPTGRVLVWHAPLDKSDLEQRSSFPLFVSQAIKWLSPDTEVKSLSYNTGQRLFLRIHQEAQRIQLPRGVQRELSADNLSTMLDEAGAWQLTPPALDQTAARAIVPVNLFDPRESDLRTAEDLPSAKETPGRPWFNEPLWTVFLAAALALAAVDWFLLHSRALV